MRRLTVGADELVALCGSVLKRAGRLGFVARGWSMAPTIRDGDTVVVDSVGPEGVNIGDIALCAVNRGRVIAHRVVGVSSPGKGTGLLAHGDGTWGEPEPLSPGAVVGIVTAVKRPAFALRLWRRIRMLANR